MVRHSMLAASVTLVALVTAVQAQAPSTDEVAAIRAVLERQTADWNRGDLDAYATGYKNSPDILFVGSTVRRGYQGMLESYRKGYPTKEAMGVLSFNNEEIHLLDARFADVIGNFHLQRSATGGGNADGTFSLIMEKTPAGWKIALDHSASAPSPTLAWEQTTGRAKPCDNPDGHRFDFWLGDWNVTNQKGEHDGDSSVRSLYGGCVLEENWRDVKTYAGKSFNTFDRAAKSWTQYWADSTGAHEQFTNGIWKDGSLVFEGHNPGPKGETSQQRFSFTPLDPDNVRQRKEDSADGGKTWTVTYELHYTRKVAAKPVTSPAKPAD